MDYRVRMESEFGSWRFQAAARKLLAGKAEPTPATLAPSPVPSAYLCRDVKTGVIVSCQNPHTLVIIVAGMSSMMFLITIAMLLLCWSVARQRRIEQRRRELSGDADATSGARQTSTNPALAPVDSPEFEDAVFVQLPGDEKPQFFAVPKPFLADDAHHDADGAKTTPDVADDAKSGESKQQSSEEDHSNRDSNAVVVQDPCVPSSDGLYRNPLFAPP